MSDRTQQTKDPVTLDDLKRAIDVFISSEWDPHDAGSYESARAEAWRTAANFIVQYVNVGGNGYREFMEGINIIREKLS